MKTRRRAVLIVAAAMLAGAVAVGCGGKQEAWRDVASPAAVLRRAKSPTLTVDGKETPDVYLRSLDIRVEVAGNIASTRHTMIFRNMTGRTLEGMLTFPLPEGRTVTYYALDINGRVREAVPVEKARAATVFEEIERRRVDPGLLERVEGNNFRTRVYPIPAYGTRTVVIGYEEELEFENGALRYALPMDYPGAIKEFSMSAVVLMSAKKPNSGGELRFEAEREGYAASLKKENYRPTRALGFSFPAPVDAPQVLMQPAQGSYYFLASVAPNLRTRKTRWSDELAIVWDVSLSGLERDMRREMELLGAVFAEKKNANVHLYFLNNRLKKIYAGHSNKKENIKNRGIAGQARNDGGEKGQARNDEIDTRHSRESGNLTDGSYKIIGGKWDGLKKALAEAVFDGGTDFSQIDLDSIAGDEILFFSDGVSTLGDPDFLSGGSAKTKRPVHCVVSSPNADYSAMKSIAAKTKGKFINIGALSPERLRNELLYETPLFLGAEHGETVREVYPGAGAPVYGNFSVAGISDTREAELTLLFGIGDSVEKRVTVKLDAKNAGTHGNEYKIWAQKKIAELDLDGEKNGAELTELGKQFGIVTRNTALIVLATRDEYAQYGVPLPPDLLMDTIAKSPILGIVTGNIKGKSVAHADLLCGGRPFDVDAALAARARKSGAAGGEGRNDAGTGRDDGGAGRNDNAGAGYLTKYGSGYVSGGDWGGGGGGETEFWKKIEPVVSSDFMKNGKLIGGVSRAKVQRVIMQNMKGFRYDYNKRLQKKPQLTGKITVKFAINEYGRVFFVQVVESESTIYDDELEAAVAARIKGCYFERSDIPDDVTEVIYPLIFSNRGSTASLLPETLNKADSLASDPVMLAIAVSAANRLKDWWSREFSPAAQTPQSKPRYPMPDQKGRTPGENDAETGRSGAHMKGLTGKIADDYRLYLKIRENYIGAPAFYFDMADWFHARGDREIALRVLTSIADLELENASLYRLLGYRFKEYGERGLEKFVCRKLVQWRPMEPQSHRDYALVLAGNGEAQAALDTLCSLLKKEYTADILDRSRGIGEVVVADINRLIAQNPGIDTSKVDGRLRADLAVDLRVVLNWNINGADIDLRVLDPSGEVCYFRNRLTRSGGLMSGDVKGGYGPEQFMLKNAMKGRYAVYVHYYGGEQVTAETGPLTVMADIYTRADGGKAEKRTVACKRLSATERGREGAVAAEIIVE